MFSQIHLTEGDARILARAGEWCGCPQITVTTVWCAITARSEARKSYELGVPAAPMAEACNHLRNACDALARSIAHKRGPYACSYNLLSCAEHQIPAVLSDTFKKIYCSCSDPSSEELSLAASESGRAFAVLRTGGFQRARAFALCASVCSIRDDLTLPDGRLSFESLKLLYKVSRHVFEYSTDAETALLRGKAATRIITQSEDTYDALLRHEASAVALWTQSRSSAGGAPP